MSWSLGSRKDNCSHQIGSVLSCTQQPCWHSHSRVYLSQNARWRQEKGKKEPKCHIKTRQEKGWRTFTRHKNNTPDNDRQIRTRKQTDFADFSVTVRLLSATNHEHYGLQSLMMTWLCCVWYHVFKGNNGKETGKGKGKRIPTKQEQDGWHVWTWTSS